jgi:hypothetical protein
MQCQTCRNPMDRDGAWWRCDCGSTTAAVDPSGRPYPKAATTFGELATGDLYRYIRGGKVFRKVGDDRYVLAGSADKRTEHEMQSTEVYPC